MSLNATSAGEMGRMGDCFLPQRAQRAKREVVASYLSKRGESE